MRASYSTRNRVFGLPGQGDYVSYETPWRFKIGSLRLWKIKVRIHQKLVALFDAACREAYETCAWQPGRIDSYAFRPIRGKSEWSLHAYACALDFFSSNPGETPQGGVWEPVDSVPEDFAACFERRGFYWGKRFSRRDVPHIEWPGGEPAIIVNRPTTPEAVKTVANVIVFAHDSKGRHITPSDTEKFKGRVSFYEVTRRGEVRNHNPNHKYTFPTLKTLLGHDKFKDIIGAELVSTSKKYELILVAKDGGTFRVPRSIDVAKKS